LLFLGTLGTGTPPLSTQGETIEAMVSDEIAGATGRDASELFQRALELRGADGLGAGEALDQALDHFLGSPLSPEAALLVGTARLLGTEPDLEAIAKLLQADLSSGDDALASAAAGLFGDTAFRSLARGKREELAGTLLEGAEDAERDPALRMRFA